MGHGRLCRPWSFRLPAFARCTVGQPSRSSGASPYQCRRKWLLESEPSLQKTRADKKFLDINEAIEEIAVLTGAELRRPCETPESAAAHPKPSILPDRPLRSRRRPCGVGLRSLGPYGTEAVTSCPQNRLQPHVMGHSLGVLHTLHCEQDPVRIETVPHGLSYHHLVPTEQDPPTGPGTIVRTFRNSSGSKSD